MSIKTLYIKDALAGTSAHGSLQDGGTPPATATTVTGWTVAKLAAGNYARMDYATERIAGSFSTTAQPDGSPDNTLGDCFRSENTLTGAFTTGSWSFTVSLIGVSRATGTQDGRIRIRVWKSVNEDGSSATELTTATATGTAVADLSNSAAQHSTGSFTPSAGALSFNGEYLFVQIAWETTGAGDNNNCDVIIRTDETNSKITTTNFLSTLNVSISEKVSLFETKIIDLIQGGLEIPLDDKLLLQELKTNFINFNRIFTDRIKLSENIFIKREYLVFYTEKILLKETLSLQKAKILRDITLIKELKSLGAIYDKNLTDKIKLSEFTKLKMPMPEAWASVHTFIFQNLLHWNT